LPVITVQDIACDHRSLTLVEHPYIGTTLSVITLQVIHCSYHVQDWDAVVSGYMHHPLHKEDKLLLNPYINARPDVPAAVVCLREREAKKVSSRRPRLGHQDMVQVPRHFYVHLRTCDLVVLSVPPAIAWEVSWVLKVTT
jgi:hypothetical protein